MPNAWQSLEGPLQSCQSLSSLLGAFLEALRSSLMASKPCRGSKERSSTAAPSPVHNKSWVLVGGCFLGMPHLSAHCQQHCSSEPVAQPSGRGNAPNHGPVLCSKGTPFPPPNLQCPVALCPSFCSADLLFPAPPDVAKSGCCSKACQRARAFSYVSTMFRTNIHLVQFWQRYPKLLPNPVDF